MINLMQEHLVPMRDVPKLLPARANGRPLHLSACYRWIEKGVRGTRLESIRVGGTTYTSREALQRFAEHLSHEAASAVAAPPPPQRHTRGRATANVVADRATAIFAPRRGTGGRMAGWGNHQARDGGSAPLDPCDAH
jgi:hypothetical protein